MVIFSLNHISITGIVEEISRGNRGESWNKRSQRLSEFFLLSLTEIHRIHRDYYHRLPCFLAPTDNEMAPETNICFHIIRWESIFPSKSIKGPKYVIHNVISEDTVRTIHDTIKLARLMKSKSIFIIHSFSGWDIFSPTKLHLISVSIHLWRGYDRMPSCIFYHFRIMNKHLSDLLFFHLELLLVGYWEPSATSIHLEMLWEPSFQRRFFDDTKDLPFYTIWSVFDHSDIDNTLRNSTSWDEDFLPRRITTKTDTSEDQFLNEDIF